MPDVAQSDKSVSIALAGKKKKLTVKGVLNNSSNNFDNTVTPVKGQIYPRSKPWKVGS
jgi:hypothetical protein